MASCQPAGGDSRKQNHRNRWATLRFWLAAASLFSFGLISLGGALAIALPAGDSHAAYAATSSSTVQGPRTVASSWSMSPLPEDQGGAVSSSTQISPVTEHSSLVMAPR